jgi:LPXTG-motif cell wall-anchored protein
MQRILKNILLLCVCILFCGMLVSSDVNAADPASITLYYRVDGNGISDVKFSLYRVAEIAENGELTLSPDFQKYSVVIKPDMTSSEWKMLAETLAGYAARDRVAPLDTANSDANGVVVFPTAGNLDSAVYLVCGASHTEEQAAYDVEPMLISVPSIGADGAYDSTVAVEVKYEKHVSHSEYSVVKLWKDEAGKYRPKNVTVQLLNLTDGSVFEEIVLNQENQWTYTWTGLPAEGNWYVVEKDIAPGYTVSIEESGNAAALTNTYHPEKNPNDPVNRPDKLPQTGTSWWLVPVLGITGAISLMLGLLWREENEK